jgi:hypothetical protein
LLLRWLNSPPPAASSYATLFFTHVFTFAETKFRRAKVGQFNVPISIGEHVAMVVMHKS